MVSENVFHVASKKIPQSKAELTLEYPTLQISPNRAMEVIEMGHPCDGDLERGIMWRVGDHAFGSGVGDICKSTGIITTIKVSCHYMYLQ